MITAATNTMAEQMPKQIIHRRQSPLCVRSVGAASSWAGAVLPPPLSVSLTGAGESVIAVRRRRRSRTEWPRTLFNYAGTALRTKTRYARHSVLKAHASTPAITVMDRLDSEAARSVSFHHSWDAHAMSGHEVAFPAHESLRADGMQWSNGGPQRAFTSRRRSGGTESADLKHLTGRVL